MDIHSADRSRRSIRLKNYDYAQPGAYFITICTQGRECLFGEVENGQMELNDVGRMIDRWWQELREKFPSTSSGGYVVMPNHIHGIIDIEKKTVSETDQGAHPGAPLPTIIQWFKTMTTNDYIRGVKRGSFQPFVGRLWQRNYYEHIIRNERELGSIRRYISQNPAKWHLDSENPSLT
jgi:REP element-mobilizing transposase RayT